MTEAKELFNLKVAKGRIGETMVIEAIAKITEVKDITNYTDFKTYQQKGIDFSFLNRKTGVWDRADAKANITETDMVFLEMYKKNGNLGWLKSSKSDYIFHYSHYTKKIYYYDLSEMRAYIDDREKKNNIKISQVQDGGYGCWFKVTNHPLIKEFKIK
jgi:hypothetical protein